MVNEVTTMAFVYSVTAADVKVIELAGEDWNATGRFGMPRLVNNFRLIP